MKTLESEGDLLVTNWPRTLGVECREPNSISSMRTIDLGMKKNDE